MLSKSSGLLLNVNTEPITAKKNIYKKHPSTVFTVSYLVSKIAASKISKEIEDNKIWSAVDHEFNWVFYKLALKVIWNWESPRLTLWGQSGFKSSLI